MNLALCDTGTAVVDLVPPVPAGFVVGGRFGPYSVSS